MSVTKIVITGGPCAGKSTALDRIRQEFTEKGFTVLVASETATELILGGISPSSLDSRVEFQRYQMLLQLEKEKIYDRAARFLKAEKVLVVFDRGLFDGRAYIDEPDFEALLKDAGATEQELLAHYDAVFHLVTAAKGAEAFYTTANNEARSETVEEAVMIDDRTIKAWENHPCRVIINNSTGFEEKLQRLITAMEICMENVGRQNKQWRTTETPGLTEHELLAVPVIRTAVNEIGYLEKAKEAFLADEQVLDDKTMGAGADNYTKYGRDMHMIQPENMDFPAYWCDAFVDWCFVQAYGKEKARALLGDFDDYTVNSADLYKRKGLWHTEQPVIGDQVFFRNDERICHTGLVIAVSDDEIITVEGNTEVNEGPENGGGVSRRQYEVTYERIAGYGRPAYEKVLTETKGPAEEKL